MGFMGNSAQSFEFSDWHSRRPAAARNFFVSLSIHIALATAAWNVNPTPRATAFPEPQLADLLDLEERRIVWYTPRQELPAVAPAEDALVAPQPDQPEQARYRQQQRITASDPDPQSLQQMVRTDTPEIELQQDVELPNIVSWKAPEVERPRFEATPSEAVSPSTEALPALSTPPVETAAAPGVDLSSVLRQQLARLRYMQQQRAQATPEERALEAEALELDVQASASTLDVSQFQQIARLRYQAEQRALADPQRQTLPNEAAPDVRAQGTSQLSITELQQIARLRYRAEQRALADPQRQALPNEAAPDVRAQGTQQVDISELQRTTRLRYQAEQRAAAGPQRQTLPGAGEAAPDIRAQGAPQVGISELQRTARLRYQTTGETGAPGPAAPTASPLGAVAGDAAAPQIAGAAPSSLGALGEQLGGTAGEINLVAVNVNPTERLPETLPSGSRRGAFTAGPEVGEGGSPAGTGAPVVVPNLSIDGPRRAPSDPAAPGADLLASVTRRTSIREAQAPLPLLDIVYNEKQIDLDNPFVGRPVYTMAVNMPNVTSYRGDWVLQFAEVAAKPAEESDAEIEQRLAVVDEELTPPFPIVKVDPKYIASAIREQVQGVVVFYAVIQGDGKLANLRLVRGIDQRLDDASREALLKWQFEPARKNSEPVAVETLIRIPFRLDPNVKMRY